KRSGLRPAPWSTLTAVKKTPPPSPQGRFRSAAPCKERVRKKFGSMDTEQALLRALRANPTDELGWLALADWLEEDDAAEQALLLRLHRALGGEAEGSGKVVLSKQVQALLARGVKPIGPRLVNALGMVFALVPPGSFMMGSPENEEGRFGDEDPLHEVRITR